MLKIIFCLILNVIVVFPVTIEIPKGATPKWIANHLAQKKVINSESAFYMYVRVRKLDSKLHSGEFEIPKNSSYKKIADILTGKVPQFISVTIPEGKTISETALILENHRIIDNHQSFLTYLKSAAIREPEAVNLFKSIPNNNFEGLLFPNTYHFSKLTPYETIMNTFIKQTYNTLLSEYQRSRSPKLSFYKTLILASIIEKEAATKLEMPIIAGVFYNRINQNMLLESCATVDYALGGPKKPVLSFKDLEVSSPYNTYLNRGLPPSPIAAPGKDAFLAALYPKKTPYLFFVSKNDGSGTHIFSKTYSEHLKNQQLTLSK